MSRHIIAFLLFISLISLNTLIGDPIYASDTGQESIRVLKLSVTNCYLIKTHQKNRYILIDTGYEHEWELFRKRLKSTGIRLSDISHIILTHHHDDHCGLLNRIVEENKDIRIVMSAKAKDLLLLGQNDRNHQGGFVNIKIKRLKLIKNKFDKNWSNLRFPPYKIRTQDILVSEDTSLNEIGIALDGKIINTPGHSKDSISVLLDRGDSFVGDAAANIPILQMAGANYCVLVLEDLDEYYRSWQRLISENARTIYPSHGRPFKAEKLKKNIGKNKKENMVTNK